MKAQKILNILLMVLVILLISIISFVGIYTQKQANMTNLIPDYQLGINLKGYRAVSLEILEEVTDEETKEKESTSSEIVAEETENTTTENEENTDENANLSKKYKIEAIPTLIIIENGKEVKRSVGLIDKNEVEKFIEN